MALPADTQLGPYKITSLIGSGGMGEVYRAHDARLRRDVALKVLPASFTNDPERLRRFELEARAVAALNHPNIVSVFDIGTTGDTHYIVSELLEGQTLREMIPATGLPVRRAVEVAVQLANGLAAAHDQNLVHRDLKPENVFVTKDGRVKILDFGLAKLRKTDGPDTITGISGVETNAGQVLGTVGYMSPEQVRGQTADDRSDIFSFGSILYEMLTGQRAFKKNTGAETMTAILNEEPAEFSLSSGVLPPALERIVRHCLEKQPGRRFQSAQDIAFDLDSLSSVSAPTVPPMESKKRRWVWPAAAGVLLLLGGLGLGAWLRSAEPEIHPKLHRITFRRGTIWGARFTPEGNLVYSAAWEGRPVEVFSAQKGNTESRPLESGTADLMAISGSGELAVTTGAHVGPSGFAMIGMLAREPLGGGAPREILDGVEYADWGPDGNSIAVARQVGGKDRLEYPIGNVLYETAGWISHPRVSPDGTMVAFIDHLYSGDDGGAVAVIGRDGRKTRLSGEYVSAQGLAWNAEKNEVWFTATTSGSSRELIAVNLSGKERLVYLGTGTLTVHDIGKDGRVLFSRDDMRSGMIAFSGAENKERDLSWHDWSVPRDMTDDARLVAFDETGEAGGETGGVYVRRMDGAPAVKLGDGNSPTMSPDGKRVIALLTNATGQRTLLEFPTGAGESRTISTGDVKVHAAYFFPDGRHIMEAGTGPNDHGLRLWVQDEKGGPPKAITPEGVSLRARACISPDGTEVAALDPEGKLVLYPVAGGDPKPMEGVLDGDRCIQWTADGKSMLVFHAGAPNVVFTVTPATKQRKPFKTIAVPDPTGLQTYGGPIFSQDLKSYVFGYTQITSDLYVVDGLK